jgi:hypothetical protein
MVRSGAMENGPQDRMPAALLWDDGELEDVRALLDDLGAEYVRCGLDTDAVPEPRLLLVTTFERAIAGLPERDADSDRPLRVAVGDRGPASHQSAVKGSGVDMVVYRPVHASILRLLLRRALYEGDEKRQGTRVPVGYGVSYGARTVSSDPNLGRDRISLKRHEAIMAELSVQGCRLLASADAPDTGTCITVEIPGALTGTSPLKVRGEVVRVEAGDAEDACLGVRFGELSERAGSELAAMVAARASGSGVTTGDPESDVPFAASDEDSPIERRRGPRVVYESEVVAMHGGVTVLLGRDLSREGLRVEAHPLLAVGERVRVSVAVNEEGPLILGAVVDRDDGPNGVVLRFDSLDEEARPRLESLIHAFPTVESLGPPGDEAILLTEVVTSGTADPVPA